MVHRCGYLSEGEDGVSEVAQKVLRLKCKIHGVSKLEDNLNYYDFVINKQCLHPCMEQYNPNSC